MSRGVNLRIIHNNYCIYTPNIYKEANLESGNSSISMTLLGAENIEKQTNDNNEDDDGLHPSSKTDADDRKFEGRGRARS